MRQLTKTILSAAAAIALTAGAATARPAQVEAHLNLRAGMGTNHRVVGVLPEGATVDVRGCSGNWCRVHWRGRTGYASASYLGGVGYSRDRRYTTGPRVRVGPRYGYYRDRQGYSSGNRYGQRYGYHPRHRRSGISFGFSR